jgi:cell division protein FtsI/penicillin-binding protein 2
MKKIIHFSKERTDKQAWNTHDTQYSEKLDAHKSIGFRLKIFGLIMAIGFSGILMRFYYVQVVQQEYYQTRLDTYTQRLYTVSSPRGEIKDRNGEVLTSNQEQLVITYLPPLRVTNETKWELANAFDEDFSVDIASMSSYQLKRAFMHYYEGMAYQLLPQQVKNDVEAKLISQDEVNKIMLEAIGEDQLLLLNDQQKGSWLIKNNMDIASGGRPKPIKENATKEEVAFLMEHLDVYPGFDVTISWDRSYPFESSLRTVLGSVTTQTQGVPAESLLSYLALGYARNDVVGKSGIEIQYEELLRGTRSIYDLSYNEEGIGMLTSQYVGEKGMDLSTSFDIGWQLHAEEVIKKHLSENKNNPYRAYMDTINFTVMDVNTGDVLVMSSITQNDDGFIYDPFATITKAIPIGSSVKGATVYMGLNEGVMKPNEVIMDQPIKIKATPLKSSYKNLGPVTDLTAISKSSNIYMFFIAMRLGGANYVYDGPLRVDLDAFALMRNYYSQFGLGTYTQIDLPNEQTGYKGSATLGGLLLDFSIGQYDNYTTMQMAQYVSTIANGGKRIAPRVVTSASSSVTGEVMFQNDVNIISKLDNPDALKRVQQGMRLCVTDDGCRGYLTRLKTPFAAKTGTAQTMFYEDGKQISSPNSTLITFGPYDKPEVATACQAPNAWNDKSQANICLEISAEILNYRYQ